MSYNVSMYDLQISAILFVNLSEKNGVEYRGANREIFLLLIVEYSFRDPCGIVTYFGKK